MTDAGVLHHFPTKESSFWATVDLYCDLQLQRFADMVEPGGLAAIGNLADWGAVIEERPDLLGLQGVLSAEALAYGSDMHEYFAARYRDLCTMIAGLIDGASSPARSAQMSTPRSRPERFWRSWMACDSSGSTPAKASPSTKTCAPTSGSSLTGSLRERARGSTRGAAPAAKAGRAQ
jgi:hypothetical protein